MNIFGVGPAEAGLIFVIALIVVGPQRFPEIMRTAGRWYRMARAYSNEVMKDVRAAVDDIEREVKAEAEGMDSLRDLADISGDLRTAREDVAAVGRETDASLRKDSPEPTPIRPSQRGSQPAAEATDAATEDAEPGDATEAVPAIEQRAAASTIGTAAGTATSGASTAKPASAREPEATPAATFDPFKREQRRKGPVLIPRETPSNDAPAGEDDEPQ